MSDPVYPDRKFYMAMIPIDKIQKDPKYLVRPLDEVHKNNLKQQIQQEGLIEPITVHLEPNGNFALLAGQHRLEALKELEGIEIPTKIYVGLDETAKRLIGYMSNETRKRPPAGKRYEALSDIFEETLKKLSKGEKIPSEEQIVNALYIKSSRMHVNELIIGLTIDMLRNDPQSLVKKYELIQNAQVPRRKIEEEIKNGKYPLLTAQNTFASLLNLCRPKPVTQKEEEENKNYRKYEYKNVREYFDRIIKEFIQPWVSVGAIETVINFCRRYPFEAFARIVQDLLVEEGLPGSSTNAAPFYHDRSINWDKLFKRLSLLKDSNLWTMPVIEQERSIADLKSRLRYYIENNGKLPDF
jgi:hypothetical protein